MSKIFLMRAAFIFLLMPAAVSAATLDDYYLAQLGEQGKTARALTEVVSGEAVPAERCLTPVYRSLKRDWSRLEPATQKVLAKHLLRPVLNGELTYPSPGGYFTVHYSAAGTADAPDPTDIDSDQIPDWVENVAVVFDHVYDVEVNQMGYRPPPVARYDVYLTNLVPQKAYGFTSDDGAPVLPGTSVGSYITIDRSYKDVIYTTGGFTPENSLDITASHEFHHAIQYGYNYYFDLWYAEVTATWMEDEVYDAVNQLYVYLPKYLPQASTLSLNAPLGGNSEYGRWVFNRYLAERHSRDLIKDIWVRLGATAAPADGSDIPMLPVIDAVLRNNGSTLSADLLGFASKLYLRDWATHVADISRIGAVAPQATYSSYPVAMTDINAKIASLPHFTFASYTFLPGPSAPTDLTLILTNVPAGIDIVAIKKGVNGSVDKYPLDRTAGTVTVPSFNSAATSEVRLIITNSTSDATPVAATPVVTASAGKGGGGGCFIATAAYGSYLHPKVAELREFRDSYLMSNAPGRLFVSLYYTLSPPIARMIAQHDWMRAGVRVALAPVVIAVEHPVGALLVLLLSGGGVVWRVARRRRSIRFASVSTKGAAC